jgi:hypothetical protein
MLITAVAAYLNRRLGLPSSIGLLAEYSFGFHASEAFGLVLANSKSVAHLFVVSWNILIPLDIC